MKKIYNQPTCLVVEISSCNVLITISGESTLNDTSYGGNASTAAGGPITSGDVKGMTDVNLWDSEW